jgi:amino acid transporter
MIGFMVGWMMWLSSIIGWAAMAKGLLLYLRYFSPSLAEGWIGEIIVISLILGLGALNFFGVKIGSRIINFFTISKLIPIFVFIAFGVFHIEASNLSQIFSFKVDNIGSAIVIGLFAYTGFEFLAVPAGEMKKPGRDIPIAFFIAILGTTLIYVLVQPTGGVLIAIGALLAIAGVNSGIALTGPRNLFALSSDGLLPKVFSRIHPEYHTPYVAIGVNTFLTLILSLTGTFEYLIFASVLVSILQYIPTCLAVIVLRRKRPVWILLQVKLTIIIATLGGIALSLPLYYFRKEKA